MDATPEREAVIAAVAAHVTGLRPGHPVRVGIDGVCGVGKTTFAAGLAEHLAATGRPVVIVDSDGFHHVRTRRRRDDVPPDRGYYENAYDLDALVERVLLPLGPGGTRVHATAVHDLVSDETIDDATATAPSDAVVLFAATFVLRDTVRPHWDVSIFLDADPDTATGRGVARDAAALGGDEAAREAYATRYAAACRLYLEEQDPRSAASIVVEHTDPARPRLVRTP